MEEEEEKFDPETWLKSVNRSLQIIITILTIIKLFINFHESFQYSISLFLDIILNFIILIDVNIIPILFEKTEKEIVYVFAITLAISWALNIFTGLYAVSSFYSNDFKGIYNFILYGRIVLIFLYVGSSGINDDYLED